MPGTVVTRMGTADIGKPAQPPFNCDPACCVNIFGARQAGAAFVWYWESSTLSWRLPNTNVVRDKDGIVVQQDEPDLEKDEDFFLDMRNGIFKSKDTVELGGSVAEFGECVFSVSNATDREEEDPEDRVTDISYATRQGRGQAASDGSTCMHQASSILTNLTLSTTHT